MAHKVHMNGGDAPNESDPDGWAVSACGREYYEKGADHKASVTCKTCLRRMNNRVPANGDKTL